MLPPHGWGDAGAGPGWDWNVHTGGRGTQSRPQPPAALWPSETPCRGLVHREGQSSPAVLGFLLTRLY